MTFQPQGKKRRCNNTPSLTFNIKNKLIYYNLPSYTTFSTRYP